MQIVLAGARVQGGSDWREICANNHWINRSLSDRRTLIVGSTSMRPYPAPPASTPSTHTGRAVDNESHHRGALPVAPRNLELRCRMLEIEKRCAIWKSDEYRRLLEQFIDGVGPSNPAAQQSVASPSSRSAPAVPGGPSAHQQQPRLVAQHDDGRARHQRSVLVQYRFE